VLFIVLSGYCLMLPVAASPEQGLSGGLAGFMKRRARRILPPYFAALVLSLLLIALVPGLGQPSGVHWDNVLPAFTPGVLVSHLLLVHNFKLEWMSKVNYTFWSVAVEWQIYFLFALLLLPLRRRFGLTVAVAAGFGLALAVLQFSPYPYEACPWFVGLFALGMAAAEVNFSAHPQLVRWRERLPWSWLSGLSALVLLVALACDVPRGQLGRDLLVGIASACLLVYCTESLQRNGRIPAGLSALDATPVAALGVFSYSLYLVHAPVLALVDLGQVAAGWSPDLRLAGLIAGGLPLVLASAYLFHLLFERRFMSKVALGGGTGFAWKAFFWRLPGHSPRIERGWLEEVGEYFGADTVTVLLALPERRQLAVHASIGLEEEVQQKIRIPIGRGVAGKIAAEGRPLVVENLDAVEVASPILRRKGLRALLGVPLLAEGRLLGVMHIGTSSDTRRFSDGDVRALARFARDLALATVRGR